jgi:hypothetical protein
MKYFVKQGTSQLKEVVRDVYVSFVKVAGCWQGEDRLLESFYDESLALEGWIEKKV